MDLAARYHGEATSPKPRGGKARYCASAAAAASFFTVTP